MQREIYDPQHTSISSFPAKILINACVSVLNNDVKSTEFIPALIVDFIEK